MLNKDNVVFENKNILIINKEIGELSQDSKDGETSLISVVKEVYKDAELINRLDRGVGGLVLIGKTKIAVAKLNELQKNRYITKKYISVVCGSAKDGDRLENYLQKNQRLNMSKVVQKNSLSKLAILEYKKLAETKVNDKVFSKVEIELFTGRHHQIRVQMANVGLGLFGDRKYHKQVRFRPTQNIGLFAYHLSFEEPFTNEKVVVEVSPRDIEPFNLF